MKNPLKKAHFEIFRLQNGDNKSRKADLQNGHFFTPVAYTVTFETTCTDTQFSYFLAIHICMARVP